MSTQRPFRFGLVSDMSSHEAWVTLARQVEDLGYSTLLVGEHPAMGASGPIAALTAAATATTTLRLGTHMLANDFRHPVMLAREVATLDVVSGGRFDFGLGSGWWHADYVATGIPFDAPAVRVSRLEEAVLLIKQLFQEEPVTFAGQYYQVRELNLVPKPTQRPHPPIFIGGGGKRVLSLAAREADIVGLDPKGTAAGTKDVATATAAAVDQQVGWIREAAASRFDALELQINVWGVVVTEHRRQAAEQIAQALAAMPPTMFTNTALSVDEVLASPRFLIGTIEQIVEELLARRERFGISFVTTLELPGFANMDAFSPVVARLAGK